MRTLSEGKPGVIVIGDHVQGLGVARSLGRKGIPVILVNDKSLCIARFSKYISKFLLCPSIEKENEFVEFLIDIGEEIKDIHGWILFPTNDAAVRNISIHKKTLENYYTVPQPHWDIINKTYNKKLTYDIAKRCGIPIPITIYPEDQEDVVTLSEEIEYPVIIKPAVMHTFYAKTKKKVFVASSGMELLNYYRTASSIIDPNEIMIQEIIPGAPGELYSYCPFFKNGKTVAMCIGRRYRQRPMDFGKATTFVESQYLPDIIDYGNRFLQEIEYYGLCEIEFKKDPRNGQYKLLEMNPRTWLWHSLAYRCGVDLPYLFYLDIIGEKFESDTSFLRGIKWIHFYTDAAVSAKEIIQGRFSLKEYITSLIGDKEFAVFSHDDLRPFIMETLMLPYLYMVR